MFALVYLAYVLALEYRLICYHCVNCYYWGKICGFGRGRISYRLFKQGNPQDFCHKQIRVNF